MLSAWKALQKRSFLVTGDEVLGRTMLERCAWNFRANESNQVYLNCRVPPKISKKRHYATGLCGGRTAFQAELVQYRLPRTSSPVTIATLRTAFQAVNAISVLLFSSINRFVCFMRFRSPEQFFSFSLKVFPFPLQFFIICADNFYYKLCNACYKLANTYYKVCNTCYKVCNKNFL